MDGWQTPLETTVTPLKRLTKHLVSTYGEINANYYKQLQQINTAQNTASSSKKAKLSHGQQSLATLFDYGPQFSVASTSLTSGQVIETPTNLVSLDHMQLLSQNSNNSLLGYENNFGPVGGDGFGLSSNFDSNTNFQPPFIYPLQFQNPLNFGNSECQFESNNFSLNALSSLISTETEMTTIIKQDTDDSTNYNGTANDPDYQVHSGEMLNYKYIIQNKLGRGSFGQVVSAVDCLSNTLVAIKIIKNKKPFFIQAKTEIALLEELNSNDKLSQYGIVSLLDTFVHKGHQCLVFELLSYNLYDLLKKTNFQGFSLSLVRKIGEQILHSLGYLKRLNIIHCDLKPENILLRDQKRSTIKIIDFGSSCKANKRMYHYIQSRFYRAPEILLGQGYSTEIDMWSLGCILMELHTGEPLFCGSNEYEQMLRIFCLKGMPESYLLDFSSKAESYFQRPSPLAGLSWRFDFSKISSSIDVSKFPRSLEEVIGINRYAPSIHENKVFYRRINTEGHSIDDYVQFIDVIRRMLEYDPNLRLDPASALLHPFFQRNSAGIAYNSIPPILPLNNSFQGLGQIPLNMSTLQNSFSTFSNIGPYYDSPILRRTGSAPSLMFN